MTPKFGSAGYMVHHMVKIKDKSGITGIFKLGVMVFRGYLLVILTSYSAKKRRKLVRLGLLDKVAFSVISSTLITCWILVSRVRILLGREGKGGKLYCKKGLTGV